METELDAVLRPALEQGFGVSLRLGWARVSDEQAVVYYEAQPPLDPRWHLSRQDSIRQALTGAGLTVGAIGIPMGDMLTPGIDISGGIIAGRTLRGGEIMAEGRAVLVKLWFR